VGTKSKVTGHMFGVGVNRGGLKVKTSQVTDHMLQVGVSRGGLGSGFRNRLRG